MVRVHIYWATKKYNKSKEVLRRAMDTGLQLRLGKQYLQTAVIEVPTRLNYATSFAHINKNTGLVYHLYPFSEVI